MSGVDQPEPAAPSLPPGPWSHRHRVIVYRATAVGLVGPWVAWWGVSGTTDLGSQLAWLNGGIAALILLGLGNCVWLLVGRQAVTGAARRLAAAGALLPDHDGEPDDVVEPRSATTVDSGQLVWVEGGTRYHREACQHVTDKRVRRAKRSTHEKARRRACEVCRP